VVGQEVADGRADGPAADVVAAYVGGLRGRHRGVAPVLAALDIGGAQSVVGQFALEPSWPVMLSPRADGGVAEQGVKTGSPPRTDAAGGGRPDMQALWAFLNGPVSPGRNPGPWRLRAAWGLMMPNCLGRPSLRQHRYIARRSPDPTLFTPGARHRVILMNGCPGECGEGEGSQGSVLGVTPASRAAWPAP